VAGAVADAEEDGFVFAFGFFEGCFAPWVPVDWVVLVLEEVMRYQPVVLEPEPILVLEQVPEQPLLVQEQ
jgi:hypothetical protein